jgi:origin recognition complex subunit 5
MLPHELQLLIDEQFPCRDTQLRTLVSLLSPQCPTKCIVIHGLEATGKTTITRCILETLEVPHAVVDSKECISGRQLLEKAVAAAVAAVADAVDETAGRCENLAALQVQLAALLETKDLTLVLDGIDRQREAPPTLIPALVRIAESVCANSLQLTYNTISH